MATAKNGCFLDPFDLNPTDPSASKTPDKKYPWDTLSNFFSGNSEIGIAVFLIFENWFLILSNSCRSTSDLLYPFLASRREIALLRSNNLDLNKSPTGGGYFSRKKIAFFAFPFPLKERL